MSDEYIAKLVEDELVETCPGEKSCHGCVSWCPLCGDTGHVCDDPECDTHRRETDVLPDMQEAEEALFLDALECKRWEEAILVEGKMERPRRELQSAVERFKEDEKYLNELEEELQEIRRPSSFLVLRHAGKRRPRRR